MEVTPHDPGEPAAVTILRGFDAREGIVARSVAFQTRVDRDLVFSETAGRNLLGGSTTRTGWAGSIRVTNDPIDVSANATLVKSMFDDTHLLVPYAPDAVVRADELRWSLLREA